MSRAEYLENLANLIVAVNCDHPTRIAIDGVDAAGKTTLADALVQPLSKRNRSVIRASIDGFHYPSAVRYQRGADSPEGYFYDSFNYSKVINSLLSPLGPGGDRHYRDAIFDYRVDCPVNREPKVADDSAILLFDGVFLLRPELVGYWDLSIFLDTAFEVSVQRAIKRAATLANGSMDPDSPQVELLSEQYRHRYIPGQQIYLESCQPKNKADLIVDNNDLAHPFLMTQEYDLR